MLTRSMPAPVGRTRRLAVGATVIGMLLLLPGVVAGADLAVTDADNGKTVTTVPDTTVSVTLTSNITTGYQWVVLTAPDSAVAALAAGTGAYTAPTSSAIGAAGTQTFVFRSVAPGTTQLVLGYQRASDTTASQTYRLDIQVVAHVALPATSTLDRPASGPTTGGPLLIGLIAGGLSLLALRRRFGPGFRLDPPRRPTAR